MLARSITLPLLAFLLASCGDDASNAATEAAVEAIDPEEAVAVELRPYLDDLPEITFNALTLRAARISIAMDREDLSEDIVLREIPGPEGAPDVKVYIADPDPGRTDKPAYLHMHGGGYILLSAADFADRGPSYAKACDCVIVSVDYRLAPETSFPGPMEDNFAALNWLYENAEELGVDRTRIAIGGESAGGGHAAQLAIAARDRGIPVVFQLLTYPMLDDRTGSIIPVPDHIGHYVWNKGSNAYAWSAYLDQPAGSKTVPYGSVPARLEDLTGLPPAWIGVGGVDLFLEEDKEYARRLNEAGVPAELYVAPGAFHAFDDMAYETAIATEFRARSLAALRQALHGEEET
ncbi:MAG: alpha/beta hydrolase [Pseudomonadota bacterium]